METSIVISGFGGQGVLFAGQLLAYAGMDDGLQVTWFPSYGPEMRGGTAHCVVIIADDPIGAPIVSHPDIAIVLNQPSYDKYEALVKPGGLLVVNSSLVPSVSSRTDIDFLPVPANAIAEEYGTPKMLNVAVIGALLGARPVLPIEVVEDTLRAKLKGDKQRLVEANLQVLRAGYAIRAAA